MAFSVTIRQSGETIGDPLTVHMGDTLLATALAAGLPLPHSCQAGNCGSCKVRLVEGEVEMTPFSEYALTDGEREDGLILACRSVPWSDCEIALLNEDEIVVHPQRDLTCTVASISNYTHDIKRVILNIEAGGPFSFSAGQYASLTFANGLARDYSMANRPEERRLEFHIRDTGGAVSRHVHDHLRPGDTVRVEGPIGTAHLRDNHDGPVLAIAGGSGLAPIKSIVETALANGATQPIHLFFGARQERDLYLQEQFRALERRHPNLRFTPVLSEPDGPTDRPVGYVGDVATEQVADLSDLRAYLAGPPVMVESTTALLTERGLAAERIHADAFYTEAEKQALEQAS
ncbi:MAG: 2Fe-2S iron-sulfur cluster-binding protein [Pseudomonadota bacterium]